MFRRAGSYFTRGISGQIENVQSTAFYEANYARLSEVLVSSWPCVKIWHAVLFFLKQLRSIDGSKLINIRHRNMRGIWPLDNGLLCLTHQRNLSCFKWTLLSNNWLHQSSCLKKSSSYDSIIFFILYSLYHYKRFYKRLIFAQSIIPNQEQLIHWSQFWGPQYFINYLTQNLRAFLHLQVLIDTSCVTS